MRNSNQPKIAIRGYQYAEAYKRGKSYYAMCTVSGAWNRCKNEKWACHEAQEMSDSWARTFEKTQEQTQ